MEEAFRLASDAHLASGQKGVYLKSVTLTSTMGPGVPLDIAAIQALSTAS